MGIRGPVSELGPLISIKTKVLKNTPTRAFGIRTLKPGAPEKPAWCYE
jgi:hypothetical protein